MSFFNEILARLGYRNQKSPDGRLRVSGQISLGDYKQYLNNAGGQFNDELIGNGAATYEGSVVGGTTLSVLSNLDAAVRQSYQWHNYFAGKPQKIELTASNFHTEAGTTKRLGYYSSSTTTPFNSNLDGLYFENDGTTIRCKITRNGTQVFNLPQSSWLNQNELTNYNPRSFNFYVIDFLYLGGAVANFWILTDKGLTLIASYQHINVDEDTFIKSPNQPVRYEIRSTGGAGSFNQICADVASEGQVSNVGAVRTYNTNSTGLSGMAAGTRYALLGVRQLAASRNVVLDFIDGSVLSDSNDDLLVEIVFGGTTVGAPTWAWIPFTNTEGFKGAAIGGAVSQKVHSGGVTVLSFYAVSNGSVAQNIETSRKLGSYINGATEEMYVCVTPLSTNGSAFASIIWREFI